VSKRAERIGSREVDDGAVALVVVVVVASRVSRASHHGPQTLDGVRGVVEVDLGGGCESEGRWRVQV